MFVGLKILEIFKIYKINFQSISTMEELPTKSNQNTIAPSTKGFDEDGEDIMLRAQLN